MKTIYLITGIVLIGVLWEFVPKWAGVLVLLLIFPLLFMANSIKPKEVIPLPKIP